MSNPIGKKLKFSIKKNQNLKSLQVLINLPIDMRDENNFGQPQAGMPFLDMSPGYQDSIPKTLRTTGTKFWFCRAFRNCIIDFISEVHEMRGKHTT